MPDCCLRKRQCHVIHYATTTAILPFGQAGDCTSAECLQFAQTPHRWRRRGPGTGLEQFSVFTDMHRIDWVGFVAPQLRPRKVADLSWIDDAHDVACLMECERDAQAVASSCLQTGVNPSDFVLAEPGNQLMPTIGRIGEALGAHLCTSPEASVECVLGNVNTQYSVSHFKAFSSDPRSNGSASINLVHRICVRTGPRIPPSLNSGALKSGTESVGRARSPKGQRRLTAFLAIRRMINCRTFATYKEQGVNGGCRCRLAICFVIGVWLPRGPY